MNRLIILLIYGWSSIAFAENGLISISAKQRGVEAEIFVKNISSKTLFIANPENCGMVVKFVSENSQGNFTAFPKARDMHWKHLVVLTPNAEDQPHLWSWSFTVQSEHLKYQLKEMEVSLWIATEEDFKKETITSLKLAKFPVTIKQK